MTPKERKEEKSRINGNLMYHAMLDFASLFGGKHPLSIEASKLIGNSYTLELKILNQVIEAAGEA